MSTEGESRRTREPGVMSRLALVAATTWRAVAFTAAFLWWLTLREIRKGPRRVLAWLSFFDVIVAALLVYWGPPVVLWPSVIALAVGVVAYVAVVPPLRWAAYWSLRWASRQARRGLVAAAALALAGLAIATIWLARRPRFVWGLIRKSTKVGITGEISNE